MTLSEKICNLISRMDIRGVDSGISNVSRSKMTIDFYMLCSFMEHVIESSFFALSLLV